jgi:hypothetical protein
MSLTQSLSGLLKKHECQRVFALRLQIVQSTVSRVKAHQRDASMGMFIAQ